MQEPISQVEINRWFRIIQPVVEGLDLTEAQFDKFFDDVKEQVKEYDEFWKEDI